MEGPTPMLNVNNLLTILQYHLGLDTSTFPHELQRGTASTDPINGGIHRHSTGYYCQGSVRNEQ